MSAILDAGPADPPQQHEPPVSRPYDQGFLRQRNFLLFLSGQTVSKIGNGVFQLGLGWSVYQLTNSAADMGLVLAVNFIPQLALALIGGTVADRMSRRSVILMADGVAGGVMLVLALLSAMRALSVPALLGAATLLGVVTAFYGPAYAAMNRDLIEEREFRKANSALTACGNLARVIGPAMGGVLFGLGGVSLLFGLDAASFAIAVTAMVLTRTADRTSGTGTAGCSEHERPSLLRELGSGLAYTARTRWLSLILVISVVANCMCLAPYAVLLPAIVRMHHSGPGMLGLLSAAEVAASVAGAVLIGRLRRSLRADAALLTLVSMLGAGTVLLGVPAAGLAAPFAGVILIGCGLSFDVIETTLLQTMVPPELLSRVYSVNMTFSYSLLPAGYVLSGLLARHIGTPSVLVAGGTILVAACGCAAVLPAVRQKLDVARC